MCFGWPAAHEGTLGGAHRGGKQFNREMRSPGPAAARDLRCAVIVQGHDECLSCKGTRPLRRERRRRGCRSALDPPEVICEALCTTGITDDLAEVALVCDNPRKAKKLSKEF